MAQKRHIVYKTNHLGDQVSWTAGLAGVVRLLTWETENALGISKTQLQQRTLDHVFQSCENEVLSREKFELITNEFDIKTSAEIESTSVDGLYDAPIKGRLISPIEAQRRIRFFSEEFLNKEFDVFMSLLPNGLLTNYFNSHFTVQQESEWTVVGSSNDFEASTGMKFMYMDTLAYSHNTSTLIALELKMDSPLGKDQLLKYCFMAAYLESQSMIAKNSTFHILFLGNDASITESIPALKREAQKQLQASQFPKKKITKEEIASLVPRATELLATVDIKNTTWQEFGTYFDKLRTSLPVNEYTETLHKLIEGFLTSLQTKYSRKKKRLIYQREV
jgi:hypothetical protein